jgi:hypothetical protein
VLVQRISLLKSTLTKGHIEHIGSREVEKGTRILMLRSEEEVHTTRFVVFAKKPSNPHAFLLTESKDVFHVSCGLQCPHERVEIRGSLCRRPGRWNTKEHVDITRRLGSTTVTPHYGDAQSRPAQSRPAGAASLVGTASLVSVPTPLSLRAKGVGIGSPT